uniref:Peptidase C1A papain C-terminal domain-containing protein n=1 Tax=Solanum lycopersicum TaxID=4081 RepID=A0A3Q7FJE1_SOLLC
MVGSSRNLTTRNQIYVLGLNRFADLTNEEYKTMYLGPKSDSRYRLIKSKNSSHHYVFWASDHVPESIDWRIKGAVALIRTKGVVELLGLFNSVEGINQIAIGDVITLSEQELVNCGTTYDDGCNGGLMDYVFQFVISNGGINTESHYPYKGIDHTCDLIR